MARRFALSGSPNGLHVLTVRKWKWYYEFQKNRNISQGDDQQDEGQMRVTGTSDHMNLATYADHMNLATNAAESHRGNHTSRGVASATRQQVSPMLNLPDETISKIIGNLELNGVCILARSCRRLNSIINNSDALCKAWFSRFPSRIQTQFKAIANKLSDRDVRAWLSQFTGDEAIADNIIARRASIYFPQCLLFTVSRLMAHCHKFNAVKQARVQHSLTFGHINSATSSADGRHVVTASWDKTAQILDWGENGWRTEKITTVTHGREVLSAIFSADGHHMATASMDNTSQIWSWDGKEWTKKATVSHDTAVNLVAFSADSCDMVTVCLGKTAQIWGFKDEQWKRKITVSHCDYINSATFSDDGQHMATASEDNSTQIFVRDKGGLWTQEAILFHDHSISSATFSPDSCYVVTASKDSTVRIWGPGEPWTKKATLSHFSRVKSASFNADGTHIVAVTSFSIYIWGRSEDGRWTKQAIVSRFSLDSSTSLSADGHHLVTTKDETIYILDLGKDGKWTQQTVSHGELVNLVGFSPDGRHFVTASKDGTAQIRGLSEGGEWVLKATISHSYGVYSASFSPDGRHVVTCGKDKIAQIWGQKEGGQWTKKATITYYNCQGKPHIPEYSQDSANFTADGRHVVICNHKVKFFDKNEAQIWALHSYEDSFASPPPLKKLKR